MTISWDRKAVIQLSKAISFIRKSSPQNAEKVKNETLKDIDRLLKNPEKYPPDKYKRNNKGNHRAFELHKLRISYLIEKEIIIITRIRHTSMKPEDY